MVDPTESGMRISKQCQRRRKKHPMDFTKEAGDGAEADIRFKKRWEERIAPPVKDCSPADKRMERGVDGFVSKTKEEQFL
jgi:hypothetical protein